MVLASLFESVFLQSQVGEYLLSASDDPIILAVNDAFLKVVARKREELVAQRLFAAFPGNPDDPGDTGVTALRSSLQRVIATGKPDVLPLQRYPIRVRAADGTEVFEERYWSATSTPILGPAGELLCISHRTEDVTGTWRMQEALRQSQTRAEAALRIAQLGTFEWSLKTDEVQRSDRTAEIYQFSEHEGFRAEDFFQRTHPDDLAQVQAIVEASLAGDGYAEQSFRLRLPDGSIRHVKSIATSERDAEGVWALHVGVATDITERVLHEQSLVEASRRKDEFLAMLAHELRNPLAPIATAAELLQMASGDPARVKKTSDIIARQVRHMAGLVDDLLDVSRVTRGQVSLELADSDVHQAVLEAIEQVRPLIDARGHELTLHTSTQPALVRADPKRLVQVLTNLLTNAARYTPRDGQIAIQLGVDADAVHLSVIDSGQGMTPELLKTCFDLFVQGERTSERGAGGLGIGLALVRSLVELHSGSVRAESEGLGKGSRFTITLPRISKAVEPVSVTPAAGEGLQHGADRLKVLIVDDNEDAAEMLALWVDTLSHEAMVEHHPLRALERIGVDPPDVCLLDIGLPDMDGYELARTIRTRLGPERVTLVAVTGYGQPQDREDALRAGFDEHFAKPVDCNTLAELLAKVGASL